MVVTTLMFTTAVTQIPSFIIMTKLGWVDSYLSIIVPAFGAPIGLYLMKQFMAGIPGLFAGGGENRRLQRVADLLDYCHA